MGNHLLDQSKEHKVVLFENRESTPKCSKHITKLCELHCEKCDVPICTLCVSSDEHVGHKQVDYALKRLKIKRNAIQQDLQELEKDIYPKYQEIISNISDQKADITIKCKKLKTAFDNQGDALHKVIDTIIEKLKHDINMIDSENMETLHQEEDEIKRTIFDITQNISDLKKVLNSDDDSLVSIYKSRNAKFRKFPPKFAYTLPLPSFIPRNINKDQIHQLFGSLLNTEELDRNHPGKIAEQFGELYDNTWTDAMEELSGKYSLSELHIIQILLQIVEDSYRYCKDICSKRYTNILAELTLWKLVEPNELSPRSKDKSTSNSRKTNSFGFEKAKITLEEIQTLHALLNSPSCSLNGKEVYSILLKIGLNVANLINIKEMLESSHEGTGALLCEHFYRQLSVNHKEKKYILESAKLKSFLKECIQICWLMVGKDPPMYLKIPEKGSKFNKNFFMEYTKIGENVKFTVWPAIFLYENGPLLKKGVLQPN